MWKIGHCEREKFIRSLKFFEDQDTQKRNLGQNLIFFAAQQASVLLYFVFAAQQA